MNRTKDNKFVYCALRKVIASVIERAGQLGVQLTQIVHKSDRQSSQFWNSGMVLAMRELVEEFGIPITHITEQSMHNKVIFTLMFRRIFFFIKDTADGEFSVVKTAIARYLKRSDSTDPDFVEIKDSASVVKFCKKHLSNPGKKAGLDGRLFYDIRPEIFLQRNAEAIVNVTTLPGISKKYQYVCEVKLTFFHRFILAHIYSKVGGAVRWRRYPCFCPECRVMEWDKCTAKKMVGEMKVVKVSQ